MTDEKDTTELTESPNPSSNPTNSIESQEYTLESALDGIDYDDVEYPPDAELLKQPRQELVAINIIIGCKLREVRLSARFTEQELGFIINVSAQRIRQYEEGEASITLAELGMICRELGADLGYFVG